MAESIEKKIGEHWSERTRNRRPIRWMAHPGISQTFNRNVYGSDETFWGDGLLDRLQTDFAGDIPFGRAVSVACGNGRKEMRLIEQGLVEHFTLFELAENRIKQGEEIAADLGISDRVDFQLADAFKVPDLEESFDLVVWLNALHHMMDTPAAMQWSRDVLKPNGVLMMDDYVGPDRFQWSSDVLEAANSIRATVPDKVFKAEGNYRPRPRLRRMATPEQVAGVDPSEAADSERILGALDAVFPDRELFRVSSGVTVFALSDIASRILDEQHRDLIARTVELDNQLMEEGYTGYAGALAQKL
jgi:SAM-dependent methyltransferase